MTTSLAAPAVDKIVRAAIHPAIGIARIGDSASGCFIGPEVVDPSPAAGALRSRAVYSSERRWVVEPFWSMFGQRVDERPTKFPSPLRTASS